jgi:methyl-accepting chemotaxis protein
MVLFALLAAGIAYYLLSDVVGRVSDLQEGSQMAAISDVSVAASGLVHELQKERGMSAGFIGSRGTKFGDALEKQRKDTDDRRAKLTQLRAAIPVSALPAAFVGGLDAANVLLGDIDARRKEVSALTLA